MKVLGLRANSDTLADMGLCTYLALNHEEGPEVVRTWLSLRADARAAVPILEPW